ncbi:unnamed protein product [Gulo gulo]|uniref:Uncharacterized protein n=1 Tax=Gulo gulo TaxID=48420 RepID=A0A9X9LFM3_GULGU|nr:unnamed protein product [Gulo gulo]
MKRLGWNLEGRNT